MYNAIDACMYNAMQVVEHDVEHVVVHVSIAYGLHAHAHCV